LETSLEDESPLEMSLYDDAWVVEGAISKKKHEEKSISRNEWKRSISCEAWGSVYVYERMHTNA